MSTDETLESRAAKWDEIRLAWETYERGGASAFDWDYASRDLMRKLTGEKVPEPDPDMVVRPQYLMSTATGLPVYDSGQRVGTRLVKEVLEGYECRWYKLPATVGVGTYNIPLEQLEFMFGGLYGHDRQLIRELDS